MEWSIFALVQMFIITIGTSLAFWLRLRAVSNQNEQLRQALRTQEDRKTAEPETWLREHLAGLSADEPTTPIITLVLEHTLEPQGDINSLLQAAIKQGGLTLNDSHTEQLAVLEQELEAAKAAAEALSNNGGEDDRTEELKQLLQQFTRDSREMMACIQTLESENMQLRNCLGLGENDPIETVETNDPPVENTEDAA